MTGNGKEEKARRRTGTQLRIRLARIFAKRSRRVQRRLEKRLCDNGLLIGRIVRQYKYSRDKRGFDHARTRGPFKKEIFIQRLR